MTGKHIVLSHPASAPYIASVLRSFGGCETGKTAVEFRVVDISKTRAPCLLAKTQAHSVAVLETPNGRHLERELG